MAKRTGKSKQLRQRIKHLEAVITGLQGGPSCPRIDDVVAPLTPGEGEGYNSSPKSEG